jgi:hypothetical protein
MVTIVMSYISNQATKMKINIWNIYASSWNIPQFRVDQPIIDDAYIFCVEMNYA